jgi:hypothetical protein
MNNDFVSRFYKYTSSDSAIKILESVQLKFSSPLEFNDPFDMSVGSLFDYNPIETLDELNSGYPPVY